METLKCLPVMISYQLGVITPAISLITVIENKVILTNGLQSPVSSMDMVEPMCCTAPEQLQTWSLCELYHYSEQVVWRAH